MMRLGSILRQWRLAERRTLKSVSQEIGISLPALQKFEVGEYEGEGNGPRTGAAGETLKKVIVWMLGESEGAK